MNGFALAGYLNDLDRMKKKAYSAVDTLNSERLAGDNNFDFMKRADELGLTSQFSGVEGINDYLKSLEKQKTEKRFNDVTGVLGDASKSIQRQKQFSDLNALEEKVGLPKADYGIKSNRQVFEESGMSQYDDPRIKDFYTMNVSDPEKLSQKSSIGGRAYSTNLLTMATEEDRKKALDIIDAIEQAGGYMDTPEQLQLDRGFAQTNPLLFMQEFSNKMRGTSEGLRGKKEAIPINAKDAATKQGAVAGAPRRLDKGELESLRNKRSIYDDLTSAKEKFNPEYATPYFGKLVKVSFLKQNVPGFADFVSDLERGVGKYRKEQFGSAQTDSEAENLKEAINKDLDVDPKVFMRQLDNFVTSIDRDYTDEIEVYKSDNVKVPEIFGSIKTKKTVNPKRDDSSNEAAKNSKFKIIGVE